jgi:hypothetical protein
LNIEAELRKVKKELMLEYDFLDIKLETEELSKEESSRMKEIFKEISRIWLKMKLKQNKGLGTGL